MSQITVDQFAKLLVDNKVGRILKVTKVKKGLSPKQISQSTKIPNNQLYYTLNKMIDADLLKIVRQEKVKNLTENYYSSLFLNEKVQVNLDNSDNILNFSDSWLKDHSQQTIQLSMLQHHEFIESLKERLSTVGNETYTMSSHSELDLSPEGEKRLMSDLLRVLNDAEKNDPDSNSENKRRVKIQLDKW